ncbi:hypothetical protein RHABOEDO_000869 [Candidatus Rhabdochlamydia oedothoracis]|uniref:Uncharacterized protein n=1 Tax=Candidatus Rhabdochlamydia oedothoracis TaxID=2720720 RepID=A0ABX8V2E6_9BACT|nr:hypothetical protein [Candidatus Rhabdochlamydia oedothoracis]QYF48667.1 hypothetical protein RHABOEDO_000869 [Candidatus Rhabdochlamydia oedothoracis]
MAIVVTTSNSASTSNINNLLEVKKITSDEEESIDKKVLDIVLIALKQMSIKNHCSYCPKTNVYKKPRSYFTKTRKNIHRKALISQKQDLTSQNQALISQQQDLTSQNQALISQKQDLTSQNQALILQKQDLTSQNQALILQKQDLTSQNQALILQKQDLTSQNQALISQQQEEKKTTIPPPPPPPPPSSVEDTKKIEKKQAESDSNCTNGAKVPKFKILYPTQELIKNQYNKIVNKPKEASPLPQTSTMLSLEAEPLQNRTNLRRTQSMHVKSNYKQTEEQGLSVSDRIKQFNSVEKTE